VGRKPSRLARWLLGRCSCGFAERRAHRTGDHGSRGPTTASAILPCHASKGPHGAHRGDVMPRAASGMSISAMVCTRCFNLVVGPADYPAAILIRGLDGMAGPGPDHQGPRHRPAAERGSGGCRGFGSLDRGPRHRRAAASGAARAAHRRGLCRSGLGSETVGACFFFDPRELPGSQPRLDYGRITFRRMNCAGDELKGINEATVERFGWPRDRLPGFPRYRRSLNSK